jgi:hypothetical protein
MLLAVVAARKLSVVIIEEHDFGFATQLGTTCHLEVGLMSVLDNRFELWIIMDERKKYMYRHKLLVMIGR